jgi:hypothetical protein
MSQLKINGQLSFSTRKAAKQSQQKPREAPDHKPKGTKHSITNYNKEDGYITQ